MILKILSLILVCTVYRCTSTGDQRAYGSGDVLVPKERRQSEVLSYVEWIQ